MPLRLFLFSVACALAVSAPLRAIDHTAWDRLLRAHVNDDGAVNYADWKKTPADLAALDAYLAKFATAKLDAPPGDAAATAALVNFYNAATIRLILDHYPLASIRDLPEPWKQARWPLAGRDVSLDHVEHGLLRPGHGWRVHVLLVCAARSCPPLPRRAATAENLAELTADRLAAWLARPELNRFDPAAKRVELSQIFDWFRADFTGEGAVEKILAVHAPERFRTFLRGGGYTVGYLPYDWALNDSAGQPQP
jgi:hypothetical protein